MTRPMTKDEAMHAISDLVMALQGGTDWDVFNAVSEIAEAMCGQTPTNEDMANYIDAGRWGDEEA